MIDSQDITKIQSKIKNLGEYYVGITQLIQIYLQELMKFLEIKDKREEIQKLISLNSVTQHNKKINDILNSTKNELQLIQLYNILNIIYDDVSKLLTYIKIIDIYDEQTLLSDKSKNNINQNKIVILDTYSKIQKKHKKILDNLSIMIINEYVITYDSYLLLRDFYLKNPNIIQLYTYIIKNYLNTSYDESSKLSLIIIYNNQIDKNKILTDHILQLKNIKNVNSNNINDFNYLFKESKFIKNQNIVTKFNNFTSYKKFISIHDLFLDIQNSNFKFKSNDINKHSISVIETLVHDYYKIERQYLNITIIETTIDKFNYNCSTLLNSNFTLNKNIGINDKYMNKTKTIITKDEYKILEHKDEDYKNDMYLSYFNNMININNFKHASKNTNNLNILLESKYILIVKLIIDAKNFEFHIMKHNNNNPNNNNIYMNFNNIKVLLQNKPDYVIENFNLIRNEKIINNIENNNMLNLYHTKIQSDYKNLPTIDNLELKNLILNNIKTNIKKIDQKLKEKNIENIINIIIDQLYKYIKKTNNIDFSPEIYLTYYSNINSLINKIKKELNDNYNSDLLNNLDNVLNNLYSNIITINSNVLDKYYLTKL
jgi:hypothetical protein